MNIKTSRIFLLMALPAHILYIIVIRMIEESDKMQLTAPFFIFYLFFALLQVCTTFYRIITRQALPGSEAQLKYIFKCFYCLSVFLSFMRTTQTMINR